MSASHDSHFKKSHDPHRYDDLLDMPHPMALLRPRMPSLSRAAQFSPFAALTGYDDQVKETARLTDTEIDLSSSALSMLDLELQYLMAHLEDRPLVEVAYFIPDTKKAGGRYDLHTGIIKRIDTYARQLIFFAPNNISNGQVIDLDKIINIQICDGSELPDTADQHL